MWPTVLCCRIYECQLAASHCFFATSSRYLHMCETLHGAAFQPSSVEAISRFTLARFRFEKKCSQASALSERLVIPRARSLSKFIKFKDSNKWKHLSLVLITLQINYLRLRFSWNSFSNVKRYSFYSWTREQNRLHHTSCKQPCGLKALGL
jgi:hypothetical protein